jgi:hypothetical protein
MKTSSMTKHTPMTPTAKAVLDTTTSELARARAENANLRRAINGFIASPRAKLNGGARGEQLRRDVAAAVARKGAPAGTRGTGKSYTAADVDHLCRDINEKLAKRVEPVRVAGKVDVLATEIKKLHSKRGA